ncbi:stress-related protein-like [Bidens hawaiensis]|uniref:stress-related protein-like n=1 Tax=Bidens hawaiensis TaxID=980011 RepID=UPI0040495D60
MQLNVKWQAQKDGGEEHLKYLGFVRTLVIYLVVFLATVYKYAKENAGSFKPRVESAENAVRSVAEPICDKFQDVPFAVLKFLDIKVGELLAALHRHLPTVMEKVSGGAKYTARNLPGASKNLASKSFKSTSKVANALHVKYEPTAKRLYKTYEPVATKYAVSAWRSLHKLPVFPQVAQIVVPAIAFLLAQYNYIVCCMADNGYQVAQYLPLVPIDEIAKVFAESEDGSAVGQSGKAE